MENTDSRLPVFTCEICIEFIIINCQRCRKGNRRHQLLIMTHYYHPQAVAAAAAAARLKRERKGQLRK